MTNPTPQAASDALLPCPFCKGIQIEQCHDDGLHWDRCKSCGATGPTTHKYSGEEDEPYNDWNTRACLTAAAQPDDDECDCNCEKCNPFLHAKPAVPEIASDDVDCIYEALFQMNRTADYLRGTDRHKVCVDNQEMARNAQAALSRLRAYLKLSGQKEG